MRCSATLRRMVAAATAAVPKNYSNTPYKKDDDVERAMSKSKAERRNRSNHAAQDPPSPHGPALTLAADGASTFIDPSSSTIATSFNNNHQIRSFRQRVCAATDVSMRPLLLLLQDAHALDAAGNAGIAPPAAAAMSAGKSKYGELLEQLSCRWAAKFYGKVTYAPRNYPYPSSRWLARRFKMKKHRIIKRFRFRRYKLAAVANLPFAKMIRVGMLPELKSSKTKKGDVVDVGLSSQLVGAARSSASTAKDKGKRSRPKSKYQV